MRGARVANQSVQLIQFSCHIWPMRKPAVVEDQQLESLVQAVQENSRMPVRDAALVLVLYETALTVTELAMVTVADLIDERGRVRACSTVRAQISHNGKVRPLLWQGSAMIEALDAYLDWRVSRGHRIVIGSSAYRGLDPQSPLFLTEVGKPFAMTTRRLPSGTVSVSCVTLGSCIVRMHAYGGISGGSAQSARRTFAVKEYRRGRMISDIALRLGHKNLTTTTRLIGLGAA